MGKESMSRINTAKQSCLASNVWYIKHLSDSKQVYGIIKEKMLKCQDSLWKFAKTGEEIHRRLLSLKLKVKEQAEKIESLLGNLKHQLAIMKTLEVDIDIKIRSCKGSCRSVHLYMINMDDYTSWKTDLAAINTSQMIQSKDLPFLNISMVQSNMTSLSTSLPIIEGMQLDLFEDIKQEVLKLEDQVYYYNSTNNMQ
ncbi:fibrinogen alpha chain [Bombina bombina]|uniref:fibrinogen alpha chain n=1 Tax=Bombina bombina TaxID=8345 RepID=UPI00235A7D15|nr:fibrinogen alpha chain [Bombina bombina]